MATPLLTRISEGKARREPAKVTQLAPVRMDVPRWIKRLEAKDLTDYVLGSYVPDGSGRGA